MLQIFATLPVTTATGGKSFIALKYLKNYLRSTMTEDRLNDLAHLYINRDTEPARPVKSLEHVTDA
jgi:20S proteasome alpha/beta subunit